MRVTKRSGWRQYIIQGRHPGRSRCLCLWQSCGSYQHSPFQQWLSTSSSEAASGHIQASEGFIRKMLIHCWVALGLLSSTTELSASFPPEQCVSFIAWSVTIHVENEIPQSDLLGEIIQSYALKDLSIFLWSSIKAPRNLCRVNWCQSRH